MENFSQFLLLKNFIRTFTFFQEIIIIFSFPFVMCYEKPKHKLKKNFLYQLNYGFPLIFSSARFEFKPIRWKRTAENTYSNILVNPIFHIFWDFCVIKNPSKSWKFFSHITRHENNKKVVYFQCRKLPFSFFFFFIEKKFCGN